jgi:hypothetical protein
MLEFAVAANAILYPFELSSGGDRSTFIRGIVRCMNLSRNRTFLPTDTPSARAHYAILQKYTAQFQSVRRMASGDCGGPFLESEFIRRFSNRPLSSFGPFVPLFLPWYALWQRRPFPEYQRIVHGLFDLLIPDYVYILLTESDFGVSGDASYPGTVPENVFILSASGVGHVAVPWLRCDYSPPRRRSIKHLISFCGNPQSSVERKGVLDVARAVFHRDLFEYRGSDWKGVSESSVFGFAPRGTAVGTCRAFELIRMEVIPVIASDEMHWLPYFPVLNWSEFSVVTNIQEMPRTANKVRSIGPREIVEMRAGLHRVSVEFFQWDAFFRRLEMFFAGERSCFTCSKAVLTSFG